MANSEASRRVGVVLFEGFELLDVFGPLEVFGCLRERFEVVLIGPSAGPVASNQGPRAACDFGYLDAPACDVILVPGGQGTRRLVEDRAFLDWIGPWAADVEYLTSVCTGAAVLAAAGLLDGRRATTNKASFGWVVSTGGGVEWVPEARWVVDGNRWTSSGVSAGIDMALALVADAVGDESARKVATAIEYEWHDDPSWDPFAAVHGLV